MQKILQFCSVIDSQIFKEFQRLPEYALLGYSCEQFYFIVFCWLIYLKASRSCPSTQVWKLIHLQTPLDWTGHGNDRQVSLPTYPAAVPGRSPRLSWGPGCCGSGCSGSPAATFKGSNRMDPDLSSAASLDPRMPRLAQCTGTACSLVHCLGPTWTSPHLHTRCAKCHASACVHAPMSHQLSPTKLRLKDRKHLDGANRE